MKVPEIRLFKEPDSSFLFYHERNAFTPWHHHPEFELVLITKGKGRRMVGDHIDRFEKNDLVFIGSDTPHEWMCDKSYFTKSGDFSGEGLVIQFIYNFLGENFFDIYENKALKHFLLASARGFEIYGQAKDQIIRIMYQMMETNATAQLYKLFSIFEILSSSKELKTLSSPSFLESFNLSENEPIQRAMKFIMQNFQRQIHVKELLQVTNMSNTAFCNAFRYTYRMSFSTYLMKLRIGYASRQLLSGAKNISEVAYDSGFDNLSNFNRQFKKIKGTTPHEYRKSRSQS
jgi:AraC-like DNA-binding protein